jgi:hypothetical protein
MRPEPWAAFSSRYWCADGLGDSSWLTPLARPALLCQRRCQKRWNDVDDTQVHPVRRADRRGDQTSDIVRRHLPGRPHNRGSHAGADKLGLQTTYPGFEHPVRTSRRRPDQLGADQHHITMSVVDHRRDELCRKVLCAHPRTVSEAGSTDQHVDGTDQVVGGVDEPIDGRRVGEIQVSGEGRCATGPKTSREFLTDVSPAGAHQYQVPAGGQPRSGRKCDGRRGFGDDDRPGLAHDVPRSAALRWACPAKLRWSATSGGGKQTPAREHGSGTKTA